jgi:hypothetical protein
MTDAYVSDPLRHPLHTLISWPAVIAGAIVAVAVGAMLNLLGVALGASAFNPYDFHRADTAGFTAAAGMWMAFANAIALFIGGAVASRAAKYADHHRGALHGLAVWALAFLLAITLASAAGAGGAAAILGGDARDGQVGDIDATRMVVPPSRVVEGQLIVPETAPLPTPVQSEKAADTAAMLALWGFLTMLIGAAAAIFGGLYGGRKHRWIERAIDGHVHEPHRDALHRDEPRRDPPHSVL